MFRNREEAGRLLAQKLSPYANRGDVVVLGIPRGGVPVAAEVARELHAPLDIFVSRKLGVPGQEELAFGAVSTGGTRVLDHGIINAIKLPEEVIRAVTARTRKEVERRESLYRAGRAPLLVAGKTVVLVDDGLATGSRMRAAVQALRQLKPAQIVVAVPVAPLSTCDDLAREVDHVVSVHTPTEFYAIGQFYEDFTQVPDEEVTRLLHLSGHGGKAEKNTIPEDDPPVPSDSDDPPVLRLPDSVTKREVSIALEGVVLQGTLALPKDAQGLVLFAHGSGSSRHSPRNQYVARRLNERGIGTLLFDLLTPEEESIDQYTGELRFNISLLAERLAGATRWTRSQPGIAKLQLGYFGASTGAAAALAAAAELPAIVAAIVSRGGRPDLAEEALPLVQAPTLLIVGGEDGQVISLNQGALARMRCAKKRMVIVPGATHLFEEPGALEEVARLAAEWFARCLKPAARKAAGR